MDSYLLTFLGISKTIICMKPYSIKYSNGRGKNGQQYAYLRPSKKCSNRSRRVLVRNIQKAIDKHFSEVNYFWIDGLIIGAKNDQFALKEYWRVCNKKYIGKHREIKQLDKADLAKLSCELADFREWAEENHTGQGYHDMVWKEWEMYHAANYR